MLRNALTINIEFEFCIHSTKPLLQKRPGHVNIDCTILLKKICMAEKAALNCCYGHLCGEYTGLFLKSFLHRPENFPHCFEAFAGELKKL